MKKRFDLGNSIYQDAKFNGLTVRNGRLINERPDGQTGIAQAAQIRKSMKVAEKVSIVARGTAMGEMLSDMDECLGCD